MKIRIAHSCERFFCAMQKITSCNSCRCNIQFEMRKSPRQQLLHLKVLLSFVFSFHSDLDNLLLSIYRERKGILIYNKFFKKIGLAEQIILQSARRA